MVCERTAMARFLNETYATLRYFIGDDGDIPTYVEKYANSSIRYTRVMFIADFMNGFNETKVQSVMGLIDHEPVDPSTMRDVFVISSDGEAFQLSRHHVALSQFLSDLVKMTDDDGEPLQVPEVPSRVWRAFNAYGKLFRAEPMTPINFPFKSGFLLDLVQERYYDFIHSMDKQLLFELVAFANKFHIKPLLDLACYEVASQFQGRNVSGLITYIQQT